MNACYAPSGTHGRPAIAETLVALAPTAADYQRGLASIHPEIGDALHGNAATAEYRAALRAKLAH